ncbi:MAG: endosialidase [Lachnospiraceae bacterium]|nr:endosialidase [Lachnospiraceae bacterium]
MAAISEIIRSESDRTVSFGDYTQKEKKKADNFSHAGNVYKVRTFAEITKLEKNDMFVYESVPGTAVSHFAEDENGVSFTAEGPADAQVTLGLKENTTYRIFIDDNEVGAMSTGISGKLSLSLALTEGEKKVNVRI